MSSQISALWNSWGRGGQLAAMGAAVAVLGLVSWLGLQLMQEDYGVLFADLAESDAAVIVKQLKKDKVPYRLSEGGTIQVPSEQVHDVRLALMSGELPLSGGVGFEIFDKQGLGATEHSQKVSYQRALQGELGRTIASMEHVRQVRVHLVMPESTLFTKDRQQATAAVAIGMEPGVTLDRQQIGGVQRLVAAAVPGLEPSRVVITDQRGVSLVAADTGGAAGALDGRLQVKRDIEEYMTQKIVRLLDSAFGPGQAIVSVDASLNFDASKTTIQDLLPAELADGSGRVVRRRQVTGSSPQPMWTNASETAASAARSPNSTTEVEYEYGRRIDEVIAAPGALSRLNVGVIVPGALTEEKRARITDLVRVAAGIDSKRGDAVSVQPLSQIGAEPALTETSHIEAAGQPVASQRSERPVTAATEEALDVRNTIIVGALIGLAIAVLGGFVVSRLGRRSFSAQEREQLLNELRKSLSTTAAAAGRAHS